MNFEKYGLIRSGKRRLYLCPLDKKPFDLEYCTPRSLRIYDQKFEYSNWVELLLNVCKYLLSLKPEYKERICEFQPNWTKSKIFSSVQKSNHRELFPELYLNLNHTALHACWLLIDLLNYFEIDSKYTEFIIFRMPRAEPKEVKDYIKEETRTEFISYLENVENLSGKRVNKIIKNIDYINRLFEKRNSGYNDLYLFDNVFNLDVCKQKFFQELSSSPENSPKMIELIKYYLKFLTKYYYKNGYYIRKSSENN